MQKPRWKADLEKLMRMVPEFELEPKKTALMIIDMTYFDAHPDCAAARSIPGAYEYYFDRLKKVVIPNLQKLLDFFRKNCLRVIYVTVGVWMPDKSDTPPIFTTIKQYLPRKDDFENQVLEEIKPQDGELVFHKTSSGVFNSTDIEHTLRNMGINGLVFTGVATPFCVETSARDAADRGFRTVMIDDACAAQTQELHDASLRAFGLIYGKVQSTDEVIAELEKGLG